MGEVASVELIKLSDKELACWVQRFVTEVRKKDWSVYPSETLYALVCGIQWYIRTEGKRAELDFFVNPIFSELKLTLDAEMKRIGRLGVGTKKQAEVISVEEEHLWSNRILGDKSPQILLTTMGCILHSVVAKSIGTSELIHVKYPLLNQNTEGLTFITLKTNQKINLEVASPNKN